MKETFLKLGEAVQNILQNTNLTLTLSGWPAAIAICAVCAAAVGSYAIYEEHNPHEERIFPNLRIADHAV